MEGDLYFIKKGKFFLKKHFLTRKYFFLIRKMAPFNLKCTKRHFWCWAELGNNSLFNIKSLQPVYSYNFNVDLFKLSFFPIKYSFLLKTFIVSISPPPPHPPMIHWHFKRSFTSLFWNQWTEVAYFPLDGSQFSFILSKETSTIFGQKLHSDREWWCS